MSLAGKCLYQGWHRPVGWLGGLIADGGPFERRRTELGRQAMETAARNLPVLSPSSNSAAPSLELHLLTGQRFWYQTAFCLWSFARQAGRSIKPVLYDDGTLGASMREPLARLFPATRFIDQSETLDHLEIALPSRRFPVLRERWLHYPNIRKLIDVHAGQRGWKLVLDSDLLFFRRPTKLLHWLESPDCPLHAIDCAESYGYSQALMERLAGHPIPALVNVGLCGLRSEAIDWDRIEAWCRELITREKTHYFLEQALVAMLIAGRKYTVAPAKDYVTGPHGLEATACTAVMHHYVADSKRAYFRHNWRRFCAS